LHSLGMLLRKELYTLLREPMVRVMIILPFIIYASMSPFYGSAVKQVEEAAKLRGARLAILACSEGDLSVAKTIAAVLRAKGVNTSALSGCNPLDAMKRGYNVVVVLGKNFVQNLLAGRAHVEIYIKGSVSSLSKTLALPGAALSYVSQALSPSNKTRVVAREYLVVNNRVWSYEQLNNLYGTANFLTFAVFFIVFPAASLGATLIGAEREERTLEVLFSLPIRRRDIAVAKSVAALLAGLLTAVSAIAGIAIFMSRVGAPLRASGYTWGDIGLYAAAIGVEALLAAVLALIVGLFSTTIRGAQAAASVTVFPALIPAFLLVTGLPVSYLFAAVPFTAALYAALSPLIGSGYTVAALVAQGAETLVALAVLTWLLETEVAVTGPETLKRLRKRLGRRRGGGLIGLLARRA